MIFRNLDSIGDWTYGFGKSCYAANDAAIALNIKTRLASWVGNCPWDLTAGIDWINRLDANQSAQLKIELANNIAQAYGVVNVTYVSSSLDSKTRNFGVRYKIDTVYSQGFENEVNVILGAQGS